MVRSQMTSCHLLFIYDNSAGNNNNRNLFLREGVDMRSHAVDVFCCNTANQFAQIYKKVIQC